MKTLACMAFGYQLAVMFLSEILGPVAAVLSLAVAFFMPHIARKQFLCLAGFQSAVVTTWIIVRKDVLTPFFYNYDTDLLALTGLAIIGLGSVLLGVHLNEAWLVSNLNSPLLQILGIMGSFCILMLGFFLASFLNLLLIRMLRLREKVGKLYPEKWWKWKRES